MNHDIVIAQYRAALKMLRAAVEACPEDLWSRKTDDNAFWHIAYHTLFYVHLYLSPSEKDFEPWDKHIPDYPHMGRLPWPPYDEPKIGDPYTAAQVLEYSDHIESLLEDLVRSAPFDAASGFYWLPFSRVELHVYSIRHIQHHAGQLIERLRQVTGDGVDWVGTVV